MVHNLTGDGREKEHSLYLISNAISRLTACNTDDILVIEAGNVFRQGKDGTGGKRKSE